MTLGASDSAGGFGADSTSDETVACRIATPLARDRIIADRLGVDIDNVITLPHGTTVADTMRIVDQTTSRLYEVVSANTENSYHTAQRVLVKRLA